jgi:hypothetical protein
MALIASTNGRHAKRRSAGAVRLSANLCLGHNQRLMMEMTKKEMREEIKEGAL